MTETVSDVVERHKNSDMQETVSDVIERYKTLQLISDALSKSNPDAVSVGKHLERVFEDNNRLMNNRIDNLEKLMNQRFEMREDALGLANKNMEMRLDKLNELRNEVVTDRSRYVVNERCEMKEESSDSRISRLERWQSQMYGIAIGIGIVAGVSGGVITKLILH